MNKIEKAALMVAALGCSVMLPLAMKAQQLCEAQEPFATFTVKHVRGNPALTLNPNAGIWKRAASRTMDKDCTHTTEYKNLKTEIRAFWTDTNLYLLFECPYTVLNLFLPPNNSQPHVGLWDRDVVEMFLGYDWQHIRHYREFEIAPTGDWIDLAIDLDKHSYDHSWRSGWHSMARIDEAHKSLVRCGSNPAFFREPRTGTRGNQMAWQPVSDRWPRTRSAAAFHVLAAYLCAQARFKSCAGALRNVHFCELGEIMKSNRRSFFKKAAQAAAIAGVAAPMQAHEIQEPKNSGEDYYEKLGVTKIINAAGTYTILTASIMPPSVQAAVALAAKNPVRLIELQTKAGEYLANKLRCEAAMVTSGASGALTLGTAACIDVMNHAPVEAVPVQVGHLKNEIIIQKAHRYSYDHALENCGGRFVEVITLADYENAFTEKTVMAHFFNAAEDGEISREDWVRVAHQHGVPCFNDAAADVPPISNLWNYTQMGFDLVTFSGGKGIRGPQNAGLLLGRKDLIAAAAATNNPFDEGIGRGLKVAKEQIVGMVAAIDWFLAQSDEGMQAEFRRRAEIDRPIPAPDSNHEL